MTEKTILWLIINTIIDFNQDYIVQDSDGERLRALAVPGDGNCFFHSISYFVEGDHKLIRQKCIEYTKAKKYVFTNFIKNHKIDE